MGIEDFHSVSLLCSDDVICWEVDVYIKTLYCLRIVILE